MVPQIDYDFTELGSLIANIKKPDDVDNSTLNELKRELNTFFKDSTCREIIYTENTDKLFFGLCVMPSLSGEQTIGVIQSDEPLRITEYYLELDSKLFDPAMNLSIEEILSLLLYDIGNVVNSSIPVTKVRNAIDMYLEKNNETLILSDSVHYAEILAFGVRDTVRKYCSIFECESEDLINGEFITACGFGTDLHQAYTKIMANGVKLNAIVNNKLIVLSWVMRLYKDVKNMRIASIREINNAKAITGSRLEKRELENVIRRLNRIDDSALLTEGAIDSMKDKYDKTLKSIKYKGVRALEDDLYEYRMRIRNVEDENDALFLLRSINTRLAIIDDYVSTEKLEEREQKRWFDLYDSFSAIRDELSKKKVYRDKQFGIIVQYPDIQPGRM